MKAATKVCLQCGQTFHKPQNVSMGSFAKRIYCSNRCSAISKHPRSTYKLDGRYIVKFCDCGQPATDHVWVYQLAGNGTPTRQFIEVCEDCRQLFIEEDPGVMLEMPEYPNSADWMPKHNEGQYSSQAHWFRDVWRSHS